MKAGEVLGPGGPEWGLDGDTSVLLTRYRTALLS